VLEKDGEVSGPNRMRNEDILHRVRAKETSYIQ